MIAFIDDHRGAHGVEPICKVLPIAPSTYHSLAARRRDPAKLPHRARRDAALMPEIERVFEEIHRRSCGLFSKPCSDHCGIKVDENTFPKLLDCRQPICLTGYRRGADA